MNVKTYDNQQKIAFIVCYFGVLPWYYKLFVKTCSSNPGVDFFIITNCEADDLLAQNVHLVRMELKEIQQLACLKFGFEAELSGPYKLCDYKPAYGFLFSDITAGFDFWGHCDLDLIFGDIRSVLKNNLLAFYDVITARQNYLAGFFTLFRNNDYCNTLFMRSPDFKKVFQDSYCYGFDEFNYLPDNSSSLVYMTDVIRSEVDSRRLKAYFFNLAIEGIPGNLKWDNGVLTNEQGQVLLLYHLNTFKNQFFYYPTKWKQLPDMFFVNDFYFSKYSPWSLRGRLNSINNRLKKHCYKLFYYIRQYSNWSVKYISGKTFFLHSQSKLTKFQGKYRGDGIEVIVSTCEGLFSVEWKGNTYLLIHSNESHFVLNKFFVGGLINVSVEFGICSETSRETLKLSSFRSPQLILYKK